MKVGYKTWLLIKENTPISYPPAAVLSAMLASNETTTQVPLPLLGLCSFEESNLVVSSVRLSLF